MTGDDGDRIIVDGTLIVDDGEKLIRRSSKRAIMWAHVYGSGRICNLFIIKENVIPAAIMLAARLSASVSFVDTVHPIYSIPVVVPMLHTKLQNGVKTTLVTLAVKSVKIR